jgi:hypothetical protein
MLLLGIEEDFQSKQVVIEVQQEKYLIFTIFSRAFSFTLNSSISISGCLKKSLYS